MILKIQKLHEDAIIPTYAHPDDSGMDLYAISETFVPIRGQVLVKTGISIQLPPGTEAQIRPRSGLALKHGIGVANSPGTVDEGYRGEIGVILENHGESAFMVAKGMKIAQMVICPVLRPEIEIVDNLSETQRGSGGFGSTGI